MKQDESMMVHTPALGPTLVKAAVLIALLLVRPAIAIAANLQPNGINLGATSFMDGFGRNKGGFTYMTYFQYAVADEIHGTLTAGGDASQPLPVFKEPHIGVYLWINQFIYTFPYKLFGGAAHAGMDFVLPTIVAFDVDFAPPTADDPRNARLTDNGIGVGDLIFGPTLQFAPVEVGKRPFFSHRFEFDVIVPTGSYDPSVDINQSSNFVSLNPYWAMSLLPLRNWDVSARFHYLYNFENVRPAFGRLYTNIMPPPVKSAQAGQAGWINFATSYDVFKGLRIGANGYYFQQFTLDKWNMLDGSSNPGIIYHDTGKRRIFAIGPGVMWSIARERFYANVYFQTLVENGPQANVFNLRWVHSFAAAASDE